MLPNEFFEEEVILDKNCDTPCAVRDKASEAKPKIPPPVLL